MGRKGKRPAENWISGFGRELHRAWVDWRLYGVDVLRTLHKIHPEIQFSDGTHRRRTANAPVPSRESDAKVWGGRLVRTQTYARDLLVDLIDLKDVPSPNRSRIDLIIDLIIINLASTSSSISHQ